MKRRHSLFLVLLLTCGMAQAQKSRAVYNVIPYPAQLKAQTGYFSISDKTALILPDNKKFSEQAGLLKMMLQQYLGSEALSIATGSGSNAIELKYDPSLTAPESYSIDISSSRAMLAAKDGAGMFYAIQTFRQLLPETVEKERGNTLLVPGVQISDKPTFAWRGMMLDVSRHFFSMQYLEKFADMMAMYKLNKLHLHLTDDQGWRIEIKKYPRLTSEGAWRTYNNQDSACMQQVAQTGNDDFRLDQQHIVQKNGQTMYGGFYTQEQMRSFIKYAASRNIEVIPEIDMPGHMMAATRIYPDLTCDAAIGSLDGVFSNPICPCKEEVLEFAKDIFTEIAELFPSKYIHIGGDEVNKKSWQESPVIQKFIKDKGFTRVEQVQSYFNDYMLAFFKAKGKTLLGWDEIIEGGIDSSAIVMFWRSWAPEMPSHAAKNRNKVVMSPSGPLYFDAIPDALTLPAVYHYNPYDARMYHLDKKTQKFIIGVQGNLWTEMIPSEKRVDYMVFPRMTALAELGWTYRYQYDAYQQRLASQYARWDALQINYRLPDITGLVENYAIIGKTPFYVASPHPRFTIRYTLDGSLPQASSQAMTAAITLEKAAVMKLALFTPGGRRGDVYSLQFNEQQISQQQNVSHLKSGLDVSLYKGYFKLTGAIKEKADSVFTSSDVAVPHSVSLPAFGLKFRGYIQVPQTGIYTFYLTCNDGGVLYVGDQKIVDNDGLHPDKTKGGQAGLQKGFHRIAVDFMDYGGGYALDLKFSVNGSKPAPIPASWLKSNVQN